MPVGPPANLSRVGSLPVDPMPSGSFRIGSSRVSSLPAGSAPRASSQGDSSLVSPTDRASQVVTLPSIERLGSLADDALIEIQRQAGAARRRVDAVNAAIAGEIARRSDRALGHQGLAARLGAATPEAAIQSLTGVSVTDARALTAVGVAIDAESPWLAPVTSAVTDGTLSVASAAAITRGLGTPTATVAADDLLDAATELVDLARESTPESAARSARVLREGLDVASVADLEAHRRSRRSLKWFEQPDGMTRMIGLFDPESAAIITGAIDAVLSPRRGGPRFVDPVDVERAAAMVADPRTNDQYAVDTLVEIVHLATRAATSTLDEASTLHRPDSTRPRAHPSRHPPPERRRRDRRWRTRGRRLHRRPDRTDQHRDCRTIHLHLRNPARHLLRHHRHRRRPHPPAPQPDGNE